MITISYLLIYVLILVFIAYVVSSIKNKTPLFSKSNNIFIDDKREDKAHGSTKLVPILLGVVIFLTASLVYITFTGDVDTPAVNIQSQEVNVNVNASDDVSDKLDLNRATVKELESLPDVGEVLASRIIEARPIYSVEQLKDIKGIGEDTFVRLRGLVKVD